MITNQTIKLIEYLCDLTIIHFILQKLSYNKRQKYSTKPGCDGQTTKQSRSDFHRELHNMPVHQKQQLTETDTGVKV